MQCNTEPEGTGQTETKPFNRQFSEPVENREVPPQQREQRFYFQYRPGVLDDLWSPGGDGDWKSQTDGSLSQEQLYEAIPNFFSDKAFDRRFCAHKNTHHILSMWVNKCSVSLARSWPTERLSMQIYAFCIVCCRTKNLQQRKLSESDQTSFKLLDAAIQLKNKLYELPCKCLTISVIVYSVHFTQSYNVWRLTEETICYLTFWNIVFSIFSMLMINRIRENSSVQDKSSSCRVPSPRQTVVISRVPTYKE